MEKNDFSVTLSMPLVHAWIEQLPLMQQQDLCHFIAQKMAEKHENSDKMPNQTQKLPSQLADTNNKAARGNFAILLGIFEKIGKQAQEIQLNELSKELSKIYPSESSLVAMMCDYDEEENSVGLSVYVSAPTLPEAAKETDFYVFFAASLMLVEPEQLKKMLTCLTLMEQKDGEKYDLDFVPVFFNDELKEYYLHCRITKLT
jgi:hypothetical protein